MKLLLTISITFLLCIASANAQPGDSLKVLLQNSTTDSARVKILGQISWKHIVDRQFDSARHFADYIRQIAKKTNNDEAKALSEFYYGVIARHQSDYTQALVHLKQYINWFKQKGDSTRVAYGLFQVSAVNSQMGKYPESLATSYRILAIYESAKSPFDIGYTLNSIGVIYRKMKRPDDAIRVYKKALTLYDSLDALEDKANVLGNLANVYTDLKEFEKARGYYTQALQVDREINYAWGIAYDLENIGNMLNQLSLPDSALHYQLEALTIREKLGQKNEIAVSCKQVGHTYFLLDQLARAEQYLSRGLGIAREIDAKPLMRDMHQILAQVYASMKEYDQAYESHQVFAQLQDSIISEETNRQLHELQARYEAVEKDKQITMLAKENEIQVREAQRQSTLKKTFIAGFALLGILTILLIYIFRQRLKSQKAMAVKDREITELKFKGQMAELEMKALRAQINPHFLFNCMNSINRMIYENKNDEASRYLTRFSKLVRLILENTERSVVTLRDELELLESYIQLESLRFKSRIDFLITVDESVNRDATYLPAMILQPFVENAIWHGLMHLDPERKGKLQIHVFQNDGVLHCSIEDNGVGREYARMVEEKSVWKSKSLGMKITEERLRLLNKEHLQQLVSIIDLKDETQRGLGTRVEINIPVAAPEV